MEEPQPGWAGISGPADLAGLLIQLGHHLRSKAKEEGKKSSYKEKHLFLSPLVQIKIIVLDISGAAFKCILERKENYFFFSFKWVRLVKRRWNFVKDMLLSTVLDQGPSLQVFWGPFLWRIHMQLFSGKGILLRLYHYQLCLLVGWQANSNPGEGSVDRTFSYFDIQNIALHHYLVMEKEKKKKIVVIYIYVWINQHAASSLCKHTNFDWHGDTHFNQVFASDCSQPCLSST